MIILRRVLLLAILVAGHATLRADSSRAPAIQWVKTVSGSGPSVAAGVAADSHGNFYITGNTTSLDLPTVAAAQPNAGGSPLIRIHPAAKSTQRLYSPGLSELQSIAVDPKNPNTLYAVSATTLLRSTDSGSLWKSLPVLPGVTALHSAAVDPTNDNILYLGTSPLGAFKSTDAGASWTPINNGIPPNTRESVDQYGYPLILRSLDVFQIWIDPNSPAVLFASVNAGLMRSADDGASWSVVLADFQGSLTFDPFASQTIYAIGSRNNYKSADGGETWTALPAPDQDTLVVLRADPFHKGVLYAGGFAGLYQSTDSGLTWTLKIKGQTLIAADPNKPVLYASLAGLGIVSSTDGFSTYSTIDSASVLAGVQLVQMQVAGSFLFVVAAPSTDVFVTKLDPDGNIVYSTYFGGSASDSAAGIAVSKDGSVYVTGQTASLDFPVTKGAYATTFPTASAPGANFVFKLNPDGSLAWSTYFADLLSTSYAIAVGSDGNAYIVGKSFGNLPTTPGVYQTQFQSMSGPCSFFCLPPTTSAFLTKFNAQGSALAFSTYISQDPKNNLIEAAQSIALAPNGNVYFADNGTGDLTPGGAGVYLMNATGTALLASNTSQNVNVAIQSIALDGNGNLYASGVNTGPFVATPGAFQFAPQPAIPNLPGTYGAFGQGDAFILKFDRTLSKVLAATLLGGEAPDVAQSVAIDPSGNVVVSGYTDSKAFPVHAPFQGSFSARSGFVAGLDSSLSHLLFSTFLGDTHPFAANGAVSDGNGNLLVVGSTLTPTQSYLIDDPGFPFTSPVTVIANKIALPPAPTVRLDSVVNFASQLGVPLSPGEAIAAIGSGFGPNAKLLFDGKPLPAVSQSANRIVAVVPSDEKTSGAVQVTVSSSGVTSNPVDMPTAVASPGIYSVDGSGVGQGYILNSDGSRNSQANPATMGSAITIFATGIGQFSKVGAFAVTDLPVAVFVNGFYASGIAAVMKEAPDLPGEVYQIGVYVPNLAGFPLPPEVPVTLFIGAFESQQGIALWVKQS